MQVQSPNTAVRFVVACCNRKHLFPLSDVVRLEARSNYTVIYSLSRPPLTVARVLCRYEPFLLKTGFIRTHRSHLINPQHIVTIDEKGSVVLCDHSKVDVSRRRRREVMARLIGGAGKEVSVCLETGRKQTVAKDC